MSVCAFPSVPRLSVVKDMIRRLQELRHTEQVQRAYALNCGEGATVSYELQLRVLREFGLADGATELLQVGEIRRRPAYRLLRAGMSRVVLIPVSEIPPILPQMQSSGIE